MCNLSPDNQGTTLRALLIERMKETERICFEVWGEVHDRPDEFGHSLKHMLWQSADMILAAALVLEEDGYLFPMYDNYDHVLGERHGPESISFNVNLNDTFMYACADMEAIDGETLYRLFVRTERGDKYAFMRWACEIRGTPIPEVKRKMDAFYEANPQFLEPMPITLLDPPPLKESDIPAPTVQEEG